MSRGINLGPLRWITVVILYCWPPIRRMRREIDARKPAWLAKQR